MTIQPDAGMAQLAARLSPPQPGDGSDAGAGADLDVYLRLTAALENNTRAQQRAAVRPRIPWEAAHPFPLFPQSSNAAGTLQDPDRWAPKDGWTWLLTRLTVTLGTGATSFTAYKDSAASPAFAVLGPNGSGTWEPKSTVFMPGVQLLVASAGGGCTVSGEGVEIALEWLPTFIL